MAMHGAERYLAHELGQMLRSTEDVLAQADRRLHETYAASQQLEQQVRDMSQQHVQRVEADRARTLSTGSPGGVAVLQLSPLAISAAAPSPVFDTPQRGAPLPVRHAPARTPRREPRRSPPSHPVERLLRKNRVLEDLERQITSLTGAKAATPTSSGVSTASSDATTSSDAAPCVPVDVAALEQQLAVKDCLIFAQQQELERLKLEEGKDKSAAQKPLLREKMSPARRSDSAAEPVSWSFRAVHQAKSKSEISEGDPDAAPAQRLVSDDVLRPSNSPVGSHGMYPGWEVGTEEDAESVVHFGARSYRDSRAHSFRTNTQPPESPGLGPNRGDDRRDLPARQLHYDATTASFYLSKSRGAEPSRLPVTRGHRRSVRASAAGSRGGTPPGETPLPATDAEKEELVAKVMELQTALHEAQHSVAKLHLEREQWRAQGGGESGLGTGEWGRGGYQGELQVQSMRELLDELATVRGENRHLRKLVEAGPHALPGKAPYEELEAELSTAREEAHALRTEVAALQVARSADGTAVTKLQEELLEREEDLRAAAEERTALVEEIAAFKDATLRDVRATMSSLLENAEA